MRSGSKENWKKQEEFEALENIVSKRTFQRKGFQDYELKK